MRDKVNLGSSHLEHLFDSRAMARAPRGCVVNLKYQRGRIVLRRAARGGLIGGRVSITRWIPQPARITGSGSVKETKAVPNLLLFSQLKNLGVPLSRRQIGRLEAQGEFPKRVQISEWRVAWVFEEVDAWVEGKIAARDNHQT